MVLYSKSSAHSAGPLRPCGLLSLARGPALARALPLPLGLALALALALTVALALLRALALPLPLPLALLYVLLYLLFLLLRLPLFCSPEAPTWTPGGAKIDPREGQNGVLEASGCLLAPRPAPSGHQGRSGAAPGRLLERSWSRLGASFAVLGRSWRLLGPSGNPREIPGGSAGGRYFWRSAPGG